jgi:hypothetical protein
VAQECYSLRSIFFFPYGLFCIKDSSEIQFWEDKWHMNIVHHKSDNTVKVLEPYPPNVAFRRDLNGPKLASWNTLLHF